MSTGLTGGCAGVCVRVSGTRMIPVVPAVGALPAHIFTFVFQSRWPYGLAQILPQVV